MKYKLGEFVRFVNEKREGFITRIIDEQTIAVTDDDGFEIPVLASQVTRVHGKSEIIDSQESDNKKLINTEKFISSGLYLAITDNKRVGSVVYFHLINSSSWEIPFTFSTEKNQELKGETNGILKPNSSIEIFSASLNELDLWPKFQIECLFFSKTQRESKKPIIYLNKFKAKDFSGSKKHQSILAQEAWIFQLDSETPLIDPQKLKESFFKAKEDKIEIPNPGHEVDLHIEKLREDFQFLSNSEILNIQISHFKKSLEAAIVHKLTSIVFIHGTGNGVLRTELHKFISKHPQVKTFMDARKEKFGYGATEVFFK